jgi:hypothetical protein
MSEYDPGDVYDLLCDYVGHEKASDKLESLVMDIVEHAEYCVDRIEEIAHQNKDHEFAEEVSANREAFVRKLLHTAIASRMGYNREMRKSA